MKAFNLFMGLVFITFLYQSLNVYTNDIYLKGNNHQIIKVYKLSQPHHQRRGFQGVVSIPSTLGLLFAFKENAPPVMWMKDVCNPLDLIFLDQNKKIRHIIYNATPYSKKYLSAKNPSIKYVLELKAGIAQDIGLSVGNILKLK